MSTQSANPPEIITLQLWRGLNQQVPRGSIDDQELFWQENLYSIGPGSLRSCWGPSAPIYTAPAGTSILRIFFGYYGKNTSQFAAPPPGRMGWMMLSDGNVDEVDLDTAAVTRIGVVWNPVAPNYWASIKVWRPQWLGAATLSVTAAAAAAGGSGYVANDTITLGNGVVVTVATLTAGAVATVTITNGGSISATTTPPANPVAQVSTSGAGTGATFNLTWTAVGGSGIGQQGGIVIGSPRGLYAWDGTTLSSPGDPSPEWLSNEVPGVDPISPMPQGLPGIYCMEVYNERLWVAGKNVISFSAPSNGANFSTTLGGGSFGYYGDKLTYAYMDLAANAGYMYVFGDSSTDIISNLQFSGAGSPTSPFTTNFTYSNLDPMVGHGFPRPVGRWGRYFVMCNGDPRNGAETDPQAGRGGIYEMTGADAQLISQKVTSIYTTLDASTFMPTFCEMTMFGFRILLLNGMFTDPWKRKRPMLLAWNGEQWCVMSQTYNLTQIGCYEDNSVIIPYGTDGTSLYRLFNQPDAALVKRFSTKRLRGTGPAMLTIKNWKRLFLEFTDIFGGGVSLTGSITAGGGGVPGGTQDIGFQLTRGVADSIEPQPIEASGIWAGIDLESVSPDFIIERLHVAADERTLFGA
jgi:hypothetical protein